MKGWRIGLMLVSISVLIGTGFHGGLAQGNRDAAQLCQDGGYLRYDSGGGVPFANVGHCVRHAADGNELVRLPRIVTVTWAETMYRGTCGAVVSVSRFDPGEYMALGGGYAIPLSVGVDGTGTASSVVPGGRTWLFRMGATYTVVVDGVASAPSTATCSSPF